ncbi:MAG: T9SS type A sorting domain-containing protein [Gemmatimonadetes bacterium]|nr:T9SS type A sorting domain-containing protein [Gemmatimonadota bacterium]
MKIINRSSINRSQPNTPRPFSTFLALAGWPTLAWLVPFLGLTAASGEIVGAVDCGDSVWDADDDERYVTRFHEHHGLIEPVEPLATYLEIRNYDRFNGAVLDDRLALVARSGADQGWSPTVGVDSWSVSLNEMYRHTGDRRYFDENLKLVRVVINNRDDRRVPQEQLWNGSVVPLWSDGTYSSRGREAYVLHTGLIAYPIFDFLLLAREDPNLLAAFDSGEYDRILADVQAAVAFHDAEWVDGPGPSEGYYHHPSDYQDSNYATVPVPFNWLSAMGRALWTSHLLTGNLEHRDRAIRLAHYCRNRLHPTPDGAYIWEYYLPRESIRHLSKQWNEVFSEDTGHAALSLTFPIMMADHGQVFDASDMMRFGQTVRCGFGRLGGGVLLGEINGDPTRFGPAQVSVMAPFLRLTPYVPEVFSIIAAYYTYFIDSEGPLDGALLRRFEPTAAVPTVVQEELERPLVAALAQPYPNPFNSSVQIEYSLAIAAPVRLEVFDVSGQRLRTLVNARQASGTHRAHWDADGVAAGPYIVRLRAGEWSQVRKLMLIK